MPSAISTPIYAAKVGNILNQDSSPAIYSLGAWTFENSSGTTTFTVSDAGAVTAGTTTTLSPIVAATTTRGYNYIVSNATFSGSLAHPPGTGHMLMMANARWNTNGSDSVVGVGAGGTSSTCLQLSDDGSVYFRSRATSSTTPDTFANYFSTTMASCTQAGVWTLGPSSGTTTVKNQILGYDTTAAGATVNQGALAVVNRSTTSEATALNVVKGANDTTTANRLITFLVNAGASGSGQINANGSSSCAFGTFSDLRLKENIAPLSGELKKILALNPVEFDYKTGGHQIGFIAQEIENIYPDVVNVLGETEEMKTVTGWDKTSARLVKAIQEQQTLIETLQAKVAALEAK